MTYDETKTKEVETKYGEPIGVDYCGNKLYVIPEYRKKKARPIHDFIFGREL